MAFHPYPGVIAAVFNRRAFGPPQGLTPASACPGVDRPASRPRCATNVALFRLAFAAARCPLTSPRSATRWLILQKARRHSARLLRLLGGARFQALFHSPPGVLFTFPSRYWSAIGRRRVFSLGGWSPQLRAGFHVARATQGRARGRGGFAYGALTRCGRPSHAVPLPPRFVTSPGAPQAPVARPATPAGQGCGLVALAGLGVRPVPLAATPGISVDFSSSGY